MSTRRSSTWGVRVAPTMPFRVLALIPLVVSVGHTAEFVTQRLVVEKVASGFQFTEGPATDGKGGIWFTDIDSEHIHRFDIASGETSLMVDDSGGANGLLFDQQGRLLTAEGFDQELTRRNGHQVEVLADSWNGQRLNSPNDMVVDSGGGIYFTDPAYYHDVQPEGVYLIQP